MAKPKSIAARLISKKRGNQVFKIGEHCLYSERHIEARTHRGVLDQTSRLRGGMDQTSRLRGGMDQTSRLWIKRPVCWCTIQREIIKPGSLYVPATLELNGYD